LPLWFENFDLSVAKKLIALKSFDAFAASIYLFRLSCLLPEDPLIDMQCVYRFLQPEIAELNPIKPIHKALFQFLENQFQTWGGSKEDFENYKMARREDMTEWVCEQVKEQVHDLLKKRAQDIISLAKKAGISDHKSFKDLERLMAHSSRRDVIEPPDLPALNSNN
jgi:hypothetical protein